jgi:hypothetical protein
MMMKRIRMSLVLRIAAFVVTPPACFLAAFVMPDRTHAYPIPKLRIEYEVSDKNLDCDGDSGRIKITATRAGVPVKGLFKSILVPATDEWITVGPTNAKGVASGWITPPAGSINNFLFVAADSSGQPVRYMGPCPFRPSDKTVDFAGRFVEEFGRDVVGEDVSAEIVGPTIGSVVPPHWTRSGAGGAFSWEGIPAHTWTKNDFGGRLRQICLSEKSRFEIVSINGEEPLTDLDPGCVHGFPLENQPVTFELRRKRAASD